MFNSNHTDPNQHLGLLPQGWEMIFDHKTGWPYFVDHNTQSTSWEDPRLNPALKMSYPQTSFGYPNSGDQKLREIPVMHESGRHAQHPGMPWQQYPQSRTPPSVSTPPRGGTPPRTEAPSPRFYTLPRKAERAKESVREIPIQHLSSRSMSPGAGRPSYPDMPRPDYPGAQGQQNPQRYPAGNMHQATGQAQMYPPHTSSQQYPGQSSGQQYPPHSSGQQYPQSYPSQYPQAYPGPHGGYPLAHTTTQQPQAPSMPHTQAQPMPQSPGQPMPQPHGYPMQSPSTQPQYPTATSQPQHPGVQSHHQQSPVPSAPECRPPEQTQEVVYNIPIRREQPTGPPHSPMTQQRQTPPSNPGQQPQQYPPQYGNRNSVPPEATQAPVDQTDSHMCNNNNNGQKQDTNQRSSSEPPKKGPKTPLDQIKDILDSCKEYEARVMQFQGSKADKEYKLLEEMMTRGILKLDGVESGSDNAVRQARKAAVHEIQSYLDQLELKAFSHATANQSAGNSSQAGNNQTQSSDTQSSSSVNRAPEAMDTSNGGSKSDKNVKEMVLDSEVSC